jgi:hypothetical protein
MAREEAVKRGLGWATAITTTTTTTTHPPSIANHPLRWLPQWLAPRISMLEGLLTEFFRCHKNSDVLARKTLNWRLMI